MPPNSPRRSWRPCSSGSGSQSESTHAFCTRRHFQEEHMNNTALKILLAATVLIPVAIYAQPRPGNPTTATVITKAEIDKISATEQSQRTRDENARVVDIGDGWSMELGIIHRASTRNPPPAPAGGRGNAAAQTIPCGQQIANP